MSETCASCGRLPGHCAEWCGRVPAQEADDQAFIDALSALPEPSLADSLDVIALALRQMQGCIEAGEAGPNGFAVHAATSALGRLRAAYEPREPAVREELKAAIREGLESGVSQRTVSDIWADAEARLRGEGMRAEYDFSEAQQGRAVDLHAARAPAEFPADRRLGWDWGKIPDGRIQFGDHWPGLYLGGKSCFLYLGAVRRALDVLPHERLTELERRVLPGVLKALARALHSALLHPKDPPP